MAPVCKWNNGVSNALDADTGNDSGSDSDGGESSASGSHSSTADSENPTRRSSVGSYHSKSRSPSPANSHGSSGSHSEEDNQEKRSRRDSESSGSTHGAARSERSARSVSGSPNRIPDPPLESFHHDKSASMSPDHKSDSASPARASSDQGSRSESPADDKSNASEKNLERSRSPSPEGNGNRKSRLRSIGSNNSRQSSVASRSGSAESDNDSRHSKERSESPREDNSVHAQGEESGSERANTKSPSKKSRSQSDSDSDDNSEKRMSRKSSGHKSDTKSNSPRSERSASPHEKNDGSHHSRSGSPTSDSGSDNGEEKVVQRKRKRTMLSDDSGSDADRKTVDEGENKEEDESEKNLVIDAEALFGDASDISSDEETRKKKGLKKSSDNEEKRSQGEESDVESQKAKSGEEENDLEGEEKDEDKENLPEEPQPETRIDVEIPKITTDLGKDIHFVKLPNFLSVETRPFDPTTYEDEIDEEETLDEEGRARLKLKVENTIRWKEITKENGEFDKQSNARFVRWSDGSMSLHLGSEIFDVYKQPLQGDHNHLFIRQGTGLQGQAVFRTKLTFRPHSTESFTHRKMTMSLADRSQKTAGIKVLSLVGKDPEAHRGELIKKEEERLKASVRRESKQRRIREKGVHRGLSASYLEPDRYGDGDSDDDGISINAIKKQHKNKMNSSRDDRSHIYSSDEDGSDIETRRAKRLDKAKALKDSDSEVSAGEDGGTGNKSVADGSSSGED